MNIQTTTTSKLGFLALNTQYVDGPVGSRSINHALQTMMSSYVSNSIEIDETLYYLRQFDFHAPSKHTPNGRTYPLELQPVHKNQPGDIAIMAVVFDIGEPNQAIRNLWGPPPIMENNSTAIFLLVDIHQLLPDNKTYWCYHGSLTTPLCIESVAWTILRMPVSLSAERMDKFHYIVELANNHPPQPPNERKITGSYSRDIEILY